MTTGAASHKDLGRRQDAAVGSVGVSHGATGRAEPRGLAMPTACGRLPSGLGTRVEALAHGRRERRLRYGRERRLQGTSGRGCPHRAASPGPAPCPRLPCPPGTCSPRWAGAAARLQAGCAGRAPLRDGRASAVTQMCRWQPGLRQPPESAGSALRAGRPRAVSSLPVAAGLVENDSTAVIGAITAGKSSPQRGIPWLPAHAVSATVLSAPGPACRRGVSVGTARCTHRGFQGSGAALWTAPGTPRGSSDLLWDARNEAR